MDSDEKTKDFLNPKEGVFEEKTSAYFVNKKSDK